MKKIDLRPLQRSRKLRIMIYVILTIIVVTSLFLFTTKKDKPTSLSMIENGELRTGPAAYYPVIFKVKKGDAFDIIRNEGKWYYIKSEDKKGWIAGWHTNLNIKPDVVNANNPFKGKTIIIDPGHGGEDQGASSPSGTKEKDITLATGLMLRDKLESAGTNVIMTRKTDEYVRLGERKGKADAFISIHFDALAEKEPHGLTVYYYSEKQKPLADTLHMAIKKKALLSDRGVRQENYQVIRQTKRPAVLLELGYISNATDEDMMKQKAYQQIVTTGIVDGLRNYFLY
ncbi:N-acetylmuramoyl-L-alanine amidase [Macrococcus sp. DPC7161]|uniref:N-acetylmuramoyl-L-alanine amidase n=1 Tax=Macrococcus sp. DPC7161 TaxID=2507060 RepID=UPI00100A3E33|nr:N-acetylmuramoyl-L-alanine amidase [Macrococcus sp. DPC7161]RXK18134.1 cell wall amidase [Macrococcus sp. DPC7161]